MILEQKRFEIDTLITIRDVKNIFSTVTKKVILDTKWKSWHKLCKKLMFQDIFYGVQYVPFHNSGVTSREMTKLPHNVGIIACKVFEPELISLGINEPQVVYLDQGLHRYPKDLCKTLADALNGLEKNEAIKKVILCYGYCGGGLEGLTSNRLELVLPLAHDCIPILLGACSANPCINCGNIFYLSPGWIEHGLTPYTEYFATAEKFSAEDALWIGKQMLKDYHEVVLIKTAAPLKSDYRHYAKDMARLFGLNYRETLGKKDWLLKLFAAENNEEVRVLAPGTKVDIKLYPMPQVIS